MRFKESTKFLHQFLRERCGIAQCAEPRVVISNPSSEVEFLDGVERWEKVDLLDLKMRFEVACESRKDGFPNGFDRDRKRLLRCLLASSGQNESSVVVVRERPKFFDSFQIASRFEVLDQGARPRCPMPGCSAARNMASCWLRGQPRLPRDCSTERLATPVRCRLQYFLTRCARINQEYAFPSLSSPAAARS